MAVIGLFGFGRWGKLIFRDLRVLGAEVRVIVPSEESRRAALAAGAISAQADCTSREEREALADVDGYVVAAPTVLHADILFKLVATGKPVFVEKPFATNTEACRKLVDVAGERIFVMDKWRYHPGIEKLAELVRSGALGEIVALRGFRLGWDNPHCDVDAIWILLPHDLSIVQHIIGRLPAPKLAMSLGANGLGNDLLAMLQDDDSSLKVTIEISANHPVSRRAVTVIGTRGSAQLGDSYDDSVVFAAGVPNGAVGKPELIPVGVQMPLLAELRAFLAHLAGGPPPLSPARDGLQVVEHIIALRKLAGLDLPQEPAP
jgi:predicted dehydrogenase